VHRSKPISGVYAAVLTPRLADGGVDFRGFEAILQFLMDSGIDSFAVNGATGEFCLTTPEQLRTILRTAKNVTQGRGNILCGIGAPGTASAIELARIAEAEGVLGLLLPMPYFFPYQQQDLEAFSHAVAGSTGLPILLYNLPQFTSGLEKETVRRLIEEVPNLIGIKDSSGSLDILNDLSLHHPGACRMVGNDGALAEALGRGVCDGVISGVACVLPELLLSLYAQRDATDSSSFARTSELLQEFITRLDLFPTPWGIKWVAEARNLLTPTFPLPVTSARAEQSREMKDWFRSWLPGAIG
jgi:4-hydroxy-tetrahydrodipicolinate synthase